MTREEAIKELKNIKENIFWGDEYGVCLRDEWVKAYEMAISALRGQEERSKGCEYCSEYKSIVEEEGCFISLDETKSKGVFLEAITWDIDLEAKVLFCPMCGRRLEET